MPEDLKLSQIGSSQLPPPFRGLHSPGVRKHCQIIFACYFRKSSIVYRKSFCFMSSAFSACRPFNSNFKLFALHGMESDGNGGFLKLLLHGIQCISIVHRCLPS